jgi:hypothetical protein
MNRKTGVRIYNITYTKDNSKSYKIVDLSDVKEIQRMETKLEVANDKKERIRI